ncbi:hypothetical protein HU675_0051015 (plasmid) [Bradyrhizobium septentrionale]|uniref:hypothetical protein n=1 Tax=Bradyrhizobium septentrionale TaxID=1404411 RepID=UPI001596FF60|nr:hypothetical protein [Bradyrhizobium septentrionale]UGY30418.1 hypothetical protein HU675_0051015 [Bradyrhizobium septentrionale]
MYNDVFENVHRTVLREVLYRHHPWFGRRVCVHGAVDKADDVVFRCSLDGSQADRWLEVPAWMFDRTACPDAELLTAQPFVSIDALAALAALLDLALKDRTPSAAPLSGASRGSHDQNRGATHVTRDGNARARMWGAPFWYEILKKIAPDIVGAADIRPAGPETAEPARALRG